MELSIIEQEKVEKVTSLVQPFDKLEYDQIKGAILSNKDDLLSYWYCQNDKCMELGMKELRKSLPKHTRLKREYSCNDGDHDSFEVCEQCGKPLNKYLTWLDDELKYLEEEILTIEDVQDEYNAFRIVGMLQSSFWSQDKFNAENVRVRFFQLVEKLATLLGEKL